MSASTQYPPVRDASGSGSPTARAWISVAVIPVFFVAAAILVSILYAVFGYTPENAAAPLWVDLVVAVAAVVVLLVPCVAAVLYGGRANRLGDRRGLIPFGIGAIAGVGLTVLTIVGTFGPF
jgi:hypothetical protein